MSEYHFLLIHELTEQANRSPQELEGLIRVVRNLQEPAVQELLDKIYEAGIEEVVRAIEFNGALDNFLNTFDGAEAGLNRLNQQVTDLLIREKERGTPKGDVFNELQRQLF